MMIIIRQDGEIRKFVPQARTNIKTDSSGCCWSASLLIEIKQKRMFFRYTEYYPDKSQVLFMAIINALRLCPFIGDKDIIDLGSLNGRLSAEQKTELAKKFTLAEREKNIESSNLKKSLKRDCQSVEKYLREIKELRKKRQTPAVWMRFQALQEAFAAAGEKCNLSI